MTPLLAQVGNAEYVQRSLDASRPERWSGEPAIMHALPAPGRTAARASAPPDTGVRLLTLADPLDHLPPGLRHEMTHARLLGPSVQRSPTACRRRSAIRYGRRSRSGIYRSTRSNPIAADSLAASAVAFMVDHMRREGREPVWGALASNTASLRLAAKLGFAPVGEIVVFSKGQWAYLTGGF